MFTRLTVDLAALQANYRTLSARFTGRETAAVVKADAYGLGAAPVTEALMKAGCRRFFVATLEEGKALRERFADIALGVFHGPFAGEEREFAHHRLVPAINSLAQLERWLNLLKETKQAPFILHVDTGMCRLGLTETELEKALGLLQGNAGGNLQMVMSHLACSGDPEHLKNAEQLRRFEAARKRFPSIPASLCNSAGLYLDKAFHADIARPGVALYGVNPMPYADVNPMKPVAYWTAPIIQLRALDRDETVGYGATCVYPKGSRIAIIQLGYADGYMRLMSNRGTVFIKGEAAPVAGRVSMDMIAVDVSHIPENKLAPGMEVEILGLRQSVDELAELSGTIGYEILTRIGHYRVAREYRSD